ncbi:CYTH domain-containing protein [Parasporobacterium paucivorans]|uniref:CYTH domain-containing protein n=1 Tax=Parasporobacterium paucivorans DSM 15970 TaxID=1122934 RepID=A0A1M6KDG6_9FIRM|nr:CYTH domain-containing protein [Parasporobacterium paucivorans]SHJ56989.1 CYTH domain-containing protein [Parasporobacterium paucivorans DSM 15970]
MEIERKFTVRQIPYDLALLPFHQIEQAYLCTQPVIRIRRQDDSYYLTYKSEGLMEREEYNLPLTEQSYAHLKTKADGNLITKKRYLIPLPENLTIELDIFEGRFSGLVIAEVEFESREQAECFIPPDWFDEDVTGSGKYHNSYLSQATF